MSVWIAWLQSEGLDDAVQAAASRGAAEEWLARRIDGAEWRAFYDRLTDADREELAAAGVTRDATASPPAALLTAYYGAPEVDGEDGSITYGDGVEVATVAEQAVYGAAQ